MRRRKRQLMNDERRGKEMKTVGNVDEEREHRLESIVEREGIASGAVTYYLRFDGSAMWTAGVVRVYEAYISDSQRRDA